MHRKRKSFPENVLSSEDVTNINNNKENLLNNFLPNELLLWILSYLNGNDLRVAELVCSTWHEIIQNYLLWKEEVIRTFKQETYDIDRKDSKYWKVSGVITKIC